MKFQSSKSNSLRLILILCSHIRIRLPSSLLLSHFYNKFYIHFLSDGFGEETEGMRPLQGLGADGRTLKWTLKKWDGRTWNGFIWLRI
jgi:hypothetical protein